jgi:hypothetical protein
MFLPSEGYAPDEKKSVLDISMQNIRGYWFLETLINVKIHL